MPWSSEFQTPAGIGFICFRAWTGKCPTAIAENDCLCCCGICFCPGLNSPQPYEQKKPRETAAKSFTNHPTVQQPTECVQMNVAHSPAACSCRAGVGGAACRPPRDHTDSPAPSGSDQHHLLMRQVCESSRLGWILAPASQRTDYVKQTLQNDFNVCFICRRSRLF